MEKTTCKHGTVISDVAGCLKCLEERRKDENNHIKDDTQDL